VLRLRARPAARAATRPLILPSPAAGALPAGQARLLPGEPARILAAGPDWQAAGAAAALALPRGTARATLDGRGLPPAEAVQLALALLLQAGPGLRLDLLHPAAAEMAPLAVRARAVLRGVRLARALLRAAGQGDHGKDAPPPGSRFPKNGLPEPAATAATPKQLARRLKRLRRHGLAVQVLKRRELRLAGFGGVLETARGAAHPPRLVVLRWAGRVAAAPVVFVGHGLCAARGAPAELGAAASCAGTLLALALRNSSAPAAAVLALAEPGPQRPAPAAIRLMLADARRYAAEAFRPGALVTLAPPGPVLWGAASPAELPGPTWLHPDSPLDEVVPWPEDAPPGGPLALSLPWACLDRAAAPGAEPGGAPGLPPAALAVRLLDALVATRFEDPHRA
jgi:leucyl aminopeptidase